MGLLDSLFSQDSYGGQGGGLLDFLRQTQAQNAQYQPAAGLPPAPSFADRFNAMPGAPQPYTPAPRQLDASTFDPATFAPNQAQPISVGGYQMPRIGSADQYQTAMQAQAAIPPNAQPTQGQLPPEPQQPMQQPLPPALGGNQIGGNIGAAFQNFAGAGGPLQAIAGGISGLLNGQRTDPAGMQQQNLKAQYDSLVPILGPQKAMLAVMNPEAGKTLLTEALTNKVDYKTEKDALGAEHGYWIDKINQTRTPAEGGTNANSSGGGVSLLAPGVQQYNPNLSGNEYLNQFGPEVQAAVKAYINGDVMPTGNPRTQALATKAKEIAQKYGQDMGIPVSDALYAEKRKYRTELGSNSANSAGGQAKAFNQGISHLSALADKLEKLDNSNGFGIPAVAGLVNSARQSMSTDQSAISDEAKSIGQTVAGEVGKLFSGSAGGGVYERELTRDRFDTVKSKPQLAAALRATVETMQGGLTALEQNRDRILGPNSGVDFIGDETRKKIEKIQGTIDRLEGRAPANNSAKPPTVIQNGHTYTLQSDGSYK